MRLATFVFCCCAFFLASCNGDGNNNDIRKNITVNNSVEERRILVTPEELTPCIKKELKLNTKYDVANYEGLEVKYFHKIMDYPTDKSREMDDELEEWMRARDQLIVKNKGELSYKDSLDYRKAIDFDKRIDSLKQELRKYKKEVTGYVFVHTFKSGPDTISAIFLMDKYCIYSEAIEVRTIPTGLNPDDYKMFIRE